MIKYFGVLFITIICLGSLSAQSYIGKLYSNPTTSPKKFTSSDTLKILAVMVSFQPDRDEETVGNGKFGSNYTRNYGNTILDPLPHNKSYFESHLEFVKNYFKKVSNGNLNIAYTVLPDTFSLPKTMRNYSPPPNSDNFTNLADFSKDVWQKADSIYPNFDFQDYQLFIIFHAGVGRDISLPGSIGNERDLPSVFLSLKSLQGIFGDSFHGFDVSGSNFKITNSMIIPETESREVQTYGGTVLYQITINGLLASSVGSYLGLPDLFDTKTGLSAIGRFGLMDGQAIFGYAGIFPPEPSPWSKIYLGWATPVTLQPGNYDVNLVAKLAANMADTVILKVPLNSSEYYLIENRSRDADHNGSIITYNVNGQTYTRTFMKDTTGFESTEVDSVYGVVTDVDDFDWAVPGNGIVIWHIDDNIISQKIADDEINADKNHRGVFVEEADGVQDIGQVFTTVLGDQVIGEGTEYDFWYKSNPSQLYQNKFSKDTRPNTNTNSGANSLITISGFSDISNKMSFKITYGDSINYIKPIFSTNLNRSDYPEFLTALEGTAGLGFAVISNGNLTLIDTAGNILNSYPEFSKFKPASTVYGNTLFVVGAVDSLLNVYMNDGSNYYLATSQAGTGITTPPVIKFNGNIPNILVGTNNGKILTFTTGQLPSTNPALIDSLVVAPQVSIRKIAATNDYFSEIAQPAAKELPSSPVSYNLYFDSQGNSFAFTQEYPVDLALTKDKNGKYLSIVLTDKNNFYIIENDKSIASWNISAPDTINHFSIADIKRDGENYILYTSEGKLEVRNLNGALADNYSVEDPNNNGFTGTPIAADFEGDNNSEILSVTSDGRIFAYDGGSGKIISGFPLASGDFLTTVPALFIHEGKISLIAANNKNNLTAWEIGPTPGTEFWSEENGNNLNSSFVDAASKANFDNQFFPEQRAYNYPNPVYGSQTYIRYYVSEDSKINIKIFDLAGDFVAELNDNARGGYDNETIWDVSGIQSGVYLARINAVSSDGKSGTKIIKIAVVK